MLWQTPHRVMPEGISETVGLRLNVNFPIDGLLYPYSLFALTGQYRFDPAISGEEVACHI